MSGGAEMRKGYWLASYPKSGNTWTRLFINAYKYGGNRINANSGLVILDANKYAHQRVCPLPLSEMSMEQMVYLRYAALMNTMSMTVVKPVIWKTHSANLRVAEVNLIPRALTEGAVILVRDPRDVVISYAEHLGKDYDHAITAMGHMGHVLHKADENIPAFVSTWSHFYRTWQDEGDFERIVVRYEDMLTDPEREFTRILEAFKFEVDADRVHEAVELTRIEKFRQQEEDVGFAEATQHTKFFKRGTSGHWREMLTEEQVARIEKDHGEMMQRLGYELALERAA